MAGTVNALASLSIVISTGVLSLTCQTVHLQIQQRANKQRNVIQIAAGSFFNVCIKKRLEATSALLMNCSVAAFSFSLCPLQALSADACRARPKENVRTQGLGRGQLLMALRWIEASSSLWPPDRKAIPVDENMNLFCLVSAHVSVSKPLNESIILTYLSQLGELCGAEQWGLPLQPPLGCIWWSSCVQEWPCWVWAECLRGIRGGLTWPCTLQPGPATQTLFY